MGQPARSEEEKQKTFQTTQLLKRPDLVLAGALVRAFFPSVKNELDRAVLINDSGACNAPLLSPKRLFTILRSSISTTMSLLNKSQELWLIAVALTLSLSFPLALNAYFSAPHFSRELFIEIKKLQPINTPPPTKKLFKTALEDSIGSPDFGSSGALRVTLQAQCISARKQG